MAGRPTNIVIAPSDFLVDSSSVMLDSSDPDWPYKMAIYRKRRRAPDSAVPRDHGLWSYHSRDGVAWETLPGLLFAAGDRNSLLPERLKGLYVNYCRHERMMELCGRRRIFRTQSPDFVNWTGPQLVLAPDLDDEIGTEYYGMSVFRRRGWGWTCPSPGRTMPGSAA